jgi:dihydrolipoamide dehydrogenase
VDDHLQTTAKNVYAIGDCAKPPLLAHKASHEGIKVVEHIAGVGPRHGRLRQHPERDVLSSRSRERRADGEGGEGEGSRHRGRHVPVERERPGAHVGETEGFVKIIRDRKYSEIWARTSSGRARAS